MIFADLVDYSTSWSIGYYMLAIQGGFEHGESRSWICSIRNGVSSDARQGTYAGSGAGDGD